MNPAFTDAITKDWGGAPFVDIQKGWKEALKRYPAVKSYTSIYSFKPNFRDR
jgi:dipeptidyl aminopeptidase/acylaminoacyl peptidase